MTVSTPSIIPADNALADLHADGASDRMLTAYRLLRGMNQEEKRAVQSAVRQASPIPIDLHVAAYRRDLLEAYRRPSPSPR